MKLHRLFLLLVAATMAVSTARAQQHTRQGAALGGIAGALAGAAIGENNGNAGSGALIGGALGLITGAAMGNARDEEAAAARAYDYHLRTRSAHAVSMTDVINMTHNGLSDSVIIGHIQQNGVPRQLAVREIIALNQAGVSESVINAMQRAPLATAVPVAVPRYRAPMVVQRYHYVDPYYHWRPHFSHHHHQRRHQRGSHVHWGFSVGH